MKKRKVAIVTLQIAVDLSLHLYDGHHWEPLEIAGDLMLGLLTDNMQMHRGGQGTLVDWQFLVDVPPVIREVSDIEHYEEDEAFNDLLPCPFCGGPVQRSGDAGDIECPACAYTFYDTSKDNVWWNTRA